MTKVVDIGAKRKEKQIAKFNAERLERVLNEFLDANDAKDEAGKALAGRALSAYPPAEVNKTARRIEAARAKAKREAKKAAKLAVVPVEPSEAS